MANYPLGIIMHISKRSKFVAAGFSAAVALLVACGSGSTTDPDDSSVEAEDLWKAGTVLDGILDSNHTAEMQELIEKCKGVEACINAAVSANSSSSTEDGTSSAATASSSSTGTSSATTASSSSAGTATSSSSGTTTSSSSKTGSSSSKASSSSVAKALSATCSITSPTASAVALDVEYGSTVVWTVSAKNGTSPYQYAWNSGTAATLATYTIDAMSSSSVKPTVVASDVAGSSTSSIACPEAKIKALTSTCKLSSELANGSATWEAAPSGGMGAKTDIKCFWDGVEGPCAAFTKNSITTDYGPKLEVKLGDVVYNSASCDTVRPPTTCNVGSTCNITYGASHVYVFNTVGSYPLAFSTAGKSLVCKISSSKISGTSSQTVASITGGATGDIVIPAWNTIGSLSLGSATSVTLELKTGYEGLTCVQDW